MQIRLTNIEDRESPGVGISDFLGQVEHEMVHTFAAEQGGYRAANLLTDASKYLVISPWSKRIRPRLVFGFASAMGLEPLAMVKLAASVEGIHTASLMHDDVVDAGELRRGQPTVNQKWSNMVAILGGDLLLSRSMLALHGYGIEVVQEGVRVVEEMTQATMMEIDARGRLDLSREEWRQIARGKTGVLLGFCGRGSAYVSGRRDELDALEKFGHHFGMAFQLADDLKDLLADVGKDRFADIRERNPSYPHIVAREENKEIFQRFEDLWSQDIVTHQEAEELGMRLVETGAVEETKKAILDQLEAAHAAVGHLIQAERGGTLDALIKSIVSIV